MYFKFKKGDIVFLNSFHKFDRERIFKIKSRKIEYGIPLYTLIEGYYITTISYSFSSLKQWIKYIFGKSNIKFLTKNVLKFDKQEFQIGFRNFPRMDNWLQEERITKLIPDKNTPSCSFNGCEIVNDFLNGN